MTDIIIRFPLEENLQLKGKTLETLG